VGGTGDELGQCVALSTSATSPPARIVTLPVDLLRHELFMTMSTVSQKTTHEIVEDVFLPLAGKRFLP
jgi:hypothetical protein